jgi:hypothetical protein
VVSSAVVASSVGEAVVSSVVDSAEDSSAAGGSSLSHAVKDKRLDRTRIKLIKHRNIFFMEFSFLVQSVNFNDRKRLVF